MIDFNLYLITDRKLVTHYASLITAVEEALKSGVKAVQLRERDLPTRELLDMAYRMRELTSRYSAKLFINDRLDIAMCVNADGVHLGQNSIPVSAVKKAIHASRITPHASRFLIGVSTHSLEEAIGAEKEGVDFITIGPVYHTPSKAQYGEPIGIDTLRKVKAVVLIPVFAIGGIKLDKVREVTNAGADGVAVISAILASDDVKETTQEFLRLLK